MGLFIELIKNIIVMVMKLFSLLKLVCLSGVRTVCLVNLTWIQLVKTAVNFHVDLFWRFMIWTVAFVSLPVRIVTALQRERLLRSHLDEMQIQLESLMWDKKELEERLQLAIRDSAVVESILGELEEEHEKAVAKIELLENELQDLKDENSRLNEARGKGSWDFKTQDYMGSCKDPPNVNENGIITEYDVPSRKAGYDGNKVVVQDLIQKDSWEHEMKGEIQSENFKKIGSKGNAPTYQFISRSLVVDEVLDQRRGVALSQSLFSAILSLLVGMIIWEAEDPCMPLVVALFFVVGMSLRSVVQFFSTIKNKPASDAVALLSFNWFILGTLTYPTLPRVAHILAPLAFSLIQHSV
ncbi:PREDICTED: uncharacterized protein LOC104610304 [Nelumbo nucifera]|uniref:Uncharacterized protein LOC104610304 n=1 Tax=Nelumbo nucifera TaxID=4432 RepID=A0A1U8Q9I3_NELNU|nr:PREDICTED: uncharacterized protein LOC104610304 [Nelumbo nucifera]XP_019055452.1 PREDICTED: uncharacterized protein LOC104610304 [Nelumbo nucifera]XP_019055453.1 PREDICTED: uncharacterized protein LOC104610304 [Nelumbo nucifera]XP_019055454.1 PREDICTED: uncharacterized protein LOC104610304 [Nelumbo nucifera]